MKKKSLRTLAVAAAGILMLTAFTACSPRDLLQKVKNVFQKETTTQAPANADPLANPPYSAYEDLGVYINVGEYKGISYTPTAVTDTQVMEQAKQYFSQNPEAYAAGVTQVPGRTKVEKGDVAVFDYEGTAEDITNETKQGMKGENFALEIGSGRFIEGFEDQIIGQALEKEFTVNVTFPDPYPDDESLSGKEAVFTCTVHSFGSFSVTDEACNILTQGQYATAKDFLAFIQSQLEQQAKSTDMEKAYTVARDQAKILKYPEAEKALYMAQIESDVSAMEASSSFDRSEWLQQNTVTDTWDDYFDGYNKDRIRDELFVYAVAKKEGLTVTQEDLDQVVKSIRDYYAGQQQDLSAETDDALLTGEFGDKRTAVIYTLREKVANLIYNNAKAESAASPAASTVPATTQKAG
ncbi:MAG: FKBP-type peptidyl-prolyl cis-trans isomerase [Oscillospiraceae bacterium]|jgi:trigger factor|nr:FKBP-type peptidyl-prolyl cis-trans isomerase [Oscillospiraceae bacterium]